MHVLHVAQPTTEGVARVVTDLVDDQVGRGWSVAVCCPAGGELSTAVRGLGANWIPWEATRSPGPSSALEALRLRRLVTAAAPDLVHLHSSKAGLVGRLMSRRGRPTVFAPHAWSFEAVSGPVRSATLAWERLAARRTDLLVCVSRAELDAGERAGVRPARTVVVPNGVDLSRWRPATPQERVAARSTVEEPDGPLAVCVGRLAEQKGQDLLLDAWPAVLSQVPAARLALVGQGPREQDLRGRALAGVRFAGVRDRVDEWLAAADVIVVPSRWEGMALVPLEAMARARSVVAFDVAGIAESVPRSAGAIVPPGDVAALADAVARRLSSDVDADAEGLAGRAHVEAEHDVRLTAGRLASAYARLIDLGGG